MSFSKYLVCEYENEGVVDEKEKELLESAGIAFSEWVLSVGSLDQDTLDRLIKEETAVEVKTPQGINVVGREEFSKLKVRKYEVTSAKIKGYSEDWAEISRMLKSFCEFGVCNIDKKDRKLFANRNKAGETATKPVSGTNTQESAKPSKGSKGKKETPGTGKVAKSVQRKDEKEALDQAKSKQSSFEEENSSDEEQPLAKVANKKMARKVMEKNEKIRESWQGFESADDDDDDDYVVSSKKSKEAMADEIRILRSEVKHLKCVNAAMGQTIDSFQNAKIVMEEFKSLINSLKKERAASHELIQQLQVQLQSSRRQAVHKGNAYLDLAKEKKESSSCSEYLMDISKTSSGSSRNVLDEIIHPANKNLGGLLSSPVQTPMGQIIPSEENCSSGELSSSSVTPKRPISEPSSGQSLKKKKREALKIFKQTPCVDDNCEVQFGSFTLKGHELKNIKHAGKVSILALALLQKLFTEEELTKCSLTGKKAAGGQNKEELDRGRVKALTEYIIKWADGSATDDDIKEAVRSAIMNKLYNLSRQGKVKETDPPC